MELAFTGGFAWAAWQVLGRLQRHVSKVEKNIDDGRLLGEWDRECKAQVAKKQRASAAMGQGATASHHDHIFEDWRNKKLRPAQIIQLTSDLAELAQWAGAGSWVPELRGDRTAKAWTEYAAGGKVHLLQAVDSLDFNFAEVVKRNAEDLAGNWLWQVTEALPALSAEPVRSSAPTERLGDLKTRLAEAEAAVRTAFDSERRSHATSLKGLVQPLAVAACMRKLQMLKVLSEEVGLTATNSAAAAEKIRTELKAPLTLVAADPDVAAQKTAAAQAIAAEADAAVEAERATRMAQIDAAAAATYRRVLTLQAASPTHWHATSTTPALHRLGMLAALLAELACCDSSGAPPGAAAAADLADAVRKLAPQMRVQLSEEEKSREIELLAALTPAPPAPPAAVEAATKPAAGADEDGNVQGEGADASDDKEPAAEAASLEAEAPPAPPSPPARPSPGTAAVELRSLLEAAIRTQLAKARAERAAERAAAREAARAARATAKAAAAAAAAEPEGAKASDEPEVAEATGEVASSAAGKGEAEAVAAEPSTETNAEVEGGGGEAAAEEKAPEEEAKKDQAVTAGGVAEAEASETPASELPTEKEAPPSKAETDVEGDVALQQEETAAEEEEEKEEEEGPTEAESVDVDGVRKAVEAEARTRTEAEKEGAIMKLHDALEALRASVAAQALKALVVKVTTTAADAAADRPNTGARLFAIESLLRDCAAASTDNALAAAVADAAGKLTASDRAALDAASMRAVERLEAATARIKLTTDSGKLDMGPGCADILRRTDAWLAQQQEAVVAAAERAAARAAKAAAAAEAAAAAKAAADEAAEKAAEKADVEGEAPKEEGEVKAEEGDAAAEEQPQEKQEVEEAPDAKAEVAQAKEEDVEEESGPTADPVRLAEGRKLVSELLAEGLVLLELPGPSNRKLQLLRESVDALDPVDGDGVVQNRLITTLKEVVGQLGPIGGSVDARLSQMLEDGERELLLQVRANAMAIYSALTAFLRLETDVWEQVNTDFEKTKKAVYGLKIERRAETLAAAKATCGDVAERCAAVARAVLGLSSPAGKEAAAPAKVALQATAEQAQVLAAALADYISYVRLREHALGIPITAKAELDDECELSLPTLDEMTGRRGEEAVWLDLAGLGLPQPPAEDEEEEEGGDEGEQGEDAAAKGAAAHEAALDELQQRLNNWHTAGLKLLSRGQAALVTLGGMTVDGSDSGELRLTADLGLPSTKSLLQLGAEKLARLQLLAAESVSGPNSGVANPLHWYLLVPPASVGPMTAFLEENEYFGLMPSQVHVYGNEVRPPLLNEEFKVVLDSSGCRTARSQPGSGEVFPALRRCGALSHMRRVGIRCVEVNSVEDNLLARPLDPAFLGACAESSIDAAAKVAVPGVQTEGPSALPELYSRYLELLGGYEPMLSGLKESVPALGSYYFSMDFVRRVDKLLRENPLALYRLAPADKVPTRGAVTAATAAKPGAAAAAPAPAPVGGAVGYRLERRLSDFASPAIGRLLGSKVHLAMVAVDAGTEFAPVWGVAPFYRTVAAKAAVDALLLQHTRWVEDSGGVMADQEEGVVEISPLVSYAGEGLAELVAEKVFEEAYVHELQGFAAESTGTSSNVGLWAVPALAMYGGVAAAKMLLKVIQK